MSLRYPKQVSKKQRDAIRRRWRAIVVDEFGTISAFRHAYEKGSRGQQVAEAVYQFLQDEARPALKEKNKDLDLSTVLAFSDMTGRALGFLVTGEGADRVGELRERGDLSRDVSAALTGVVPSALRDAGLHVDGTSALAFVFLKVKAICDSLEPLVALGSILDAQFLLPSQKKKLVQAIEAASRQATSECPGLLTLDGRTLLHTTLSLRGKPHPNPALRRTVEDSLEIARLNAEASLRAESAEVSTERTDAL